MHVSVGKPEKVTDSYRGLNGVVKGKACSIPTESTEESISLGKKDDKWIVEQKMGVP